jgi:hypothetical protein
MRKMSAIAKSNSPSPAQRTTGGRGSKSNFLSVEVSHPRNWWGYKKLYQRFEEVYAQIA